jgi:Icc-related predicted phosphoesterase
MLQKIPRYQRTLLLAALWLASCGPVFAQDCVWTGVARTVAVGDVHGDYGQFVKTLRAAGVIDDKSNWIGGKTHLVQTGDVLDRGPESRNVMNLLMELEEQSLKKGGRVHALIGNHEAMVLAGDLRYVDPGEYAAFGDSAGYRAAMAADGKYGTWIRGHNAVVKINDVLFVHGGIASSQANTPLETINRTIRDELRESPKSGKGMTRDPSGPLWYRGLATDDEQSLDQTLTTVLKAYGVSRIVVGHTPSKGALTPRAGGRVIVIDVGMSSHYGGPAACLVIESGKYFSASPDSSSELPVGAPVPGIRKE